MNGPVIRPVACAGIAIALLASGSSAAAADDGRLAFNGHCRTCHSLREGDDRLGPSLHNIFGAKAAASQGYASFSQGLRNSGVVWDAQTLDKFIASPDQVIPGNNMKPYAGIPDASVRKRIVEFLKAESEG